MSGGLEGGVVDTLGGSTLAEWLFGALNEAILGGELAPGSKISEQMHELYAIICRGRFIVPIADLSARGVGADKWRWAR